MSSASFDLIPLLIVVGIALLFYGLTIVPRWRSEGRWIWQLGLFLILLAIYIVLASASGAFEGLRWPSISVSRQDRTFILLMAWILILYAILSGRTHTHPPGSPKP